MSQATDLALQVAVPSRLAKIVANDAFGQDWEASEFILQIEAAIVEACLNEKSHDWFIVNLPNQVGKTSYFGILLCMWYIGMFPDKQIIFISYSDTYSIRYGRMVRDLMKKYGPSLFGVTVDPANDAAGDWTLKGHRGGMLSVGIGGQITGRQGHLVIIDDVLRNMVDAASVPIKNSHWEDWKGTIYGRRQPGSVYVVTATRLAEDDLSGRLLEEQRHGGGLDWKPMIYPGICEPPNDYTGPEEDYVDLLGRHIGEPLVCRFTQPEDTIEKNWWTEAKKGLKNDLLFDCMVQQNPGRSSGGMFPDTMWKYEFRKDWPQLFVKVRSWDMASTKGGGDYTTGALLGMDYDNNIYVVGRERGQWGPDEGLQKMKSTAMRDGGGVIIQVEQEKSGAGKNNVAFYQNALKGYQCHPAKAEGTKEQRAHTYSTLQQGGKVILPADEEDAEWVKEWVKEHSAMMGDGRRPPHDDQIDTAAYGVLFLQDNHVVDVADPNEPMTLERMLAMEALLDAAGY